MIDHYEADVQTAQDYYPFGMIMPGRMFTALTVPGGSVTGTTQVNGFTVPVDLALTSRSGNEPTQYAASRTIDLEEGFESGTNDDVTAYLTDTSYAGSGNGGSGADGVAGAGRYRYGFNGKEQDNEVKGIGDQIDYGMRVYDPRAGRFLSVDPLQKKFAYYTPYQFAGDKPIAHVDLDGLEEYYYTYNTYQKNGQTWVNVHQERAYDNFLERAMGAQYWLKPQGASPNDQGICFDTYEDMFDAAKKFAFGKAAFATEYQKFDQKRWQTFKVIIATEIASGAHAALEETMAGKVAAAEAKAAQKAYTPGTNSTNNQATSANSGNNEASSSNRGTGTALEDVKNRNAQAQAYEDGTTGAASDVVSKKRLVPTLRYDNPNPNGRSFVKFDGIDIENNELIDRKWNVTTFPKSLNQLQRMSDALAQNPGYSGVIEVPNQKAYRNAINAVTKSGVSNISVRIAK